MQVGRSMFAVWALPGQPLKRSFQRILGWCCLSGALALAGGFAPGEYPRAGLWLAAVAVDVLGAVAGYWTPWLGRSTTQEWDIEGVHFAERCKAFILIALGESLVVIGATLAGLLGPLSGTYPHRAATIAAFVVAFVGSAALWWVYFDRSADEGARRIAESADPGRLGRSAYHLIHPVMVAGIIVTATADEVMLTEPNAVGVLATSWLILGGVGLYIGGHLAFKFAVWRQVSRQRAVALIAIAVLGLLAPHISALELGSCAAAVVVGVAVADYFQLRRQATIRGPSATP
jgi:low temperature requirement protein LtrA